MREREARLEMSLRDDSGLDSIQSKFMLELRGSARFR
jgi:hypothetical protein